MFNLCQAQGVFLLTLAQQVNYTDEVLAIAIPGVSVSLRIYLSMMVTNG